MDDQGGYLRAKVGRKGDTAWLMKMSFGDNISSALGLAALKKYTAKLEKNTAKMDLKIFQKLICKFFNK